MSIKFIEYPICNHCNSPVIDLTKALRLSGVILNGDASGIAEEVHGMDEKIFHKNCLAKVLGIESQPQGLSDLMRFVPYNPPLSHCAGCRCFDAFKTVGLDVK